MREILYIVGVCVGCFLVAVGVVVIPAYFVTKYECNKYSELNNVNTQMILLTCYVENDSRWMPYKEYVARVIASEGLKNDR